ncbi:MAG TPA: hypothetical protein VD835_07040 [Pyrinomonadaceae bacterium]|nr:hypothetical protein [Pyrinomonadaceae bacterium]
MRAAAPVGKAKEHEMNAWLKRLELPITAALVIAGAAFLLKMCYLPLVTCTLLGGAWLAAVYWYVRALYKIVMPPLLLLLVFAALQVDALGNFFSMYGRAVFGSVMYDEFAHLAVQTLTMPLIVWLLSEVLRRFGQPLPLGLSIFFSVAVFFSLSAFYEIIELWDELYFGGQRIWSKHDAPNDLQWDFAGILIGALLAYVILRRARHVETASAT